MAVNTTLDKSKIIVGTQQERVERAINEIDANGEAFQKVKKLM